MMRIGGDRRFRKQTQLIEEIEKATNESGKNIKILCLKGDSDYWKKYDEVSGK